MQPIGCMDNDPEPSRGVPCQCLLWKTDQFRLDPTQSCAPRKRCDRVSSPRTCKVLWHLPIYDQPLQLCPACLPTTTSIQPTILMTNYTHACNRLSRMWKSDCSTRQKQKHAPTVINSYVLHTLL